MLNLFWCPVRLLLVSILLSGLMGGCICMGDAAAPIPPSKLPGVWTGTCDVSRGFSRMELYSDGTGLYGDDFVYKITKWTVSKEVSSTTYKFHAVLEPISPQRKPGEILGTVGASGISYRATWATDGSIKGYLTREDELTKLKDRMAPYSRSTSQPIRRR
jgi:hypothetical protein